MSKEIFDWEKQEKISLSQSELALTSLLELQRKKQQIIDSGEDLSVVSKNTYDGALGNFALISDLVKITKFARFVPDQKNWQLSFDRDNRFAISIRSLGSENRFGFWYTPATSKGRDNLGARVVTRELIGALFGDREFIDYDLGTDQVAVRELGKLSKEKIFDKFETVIKHQIK